jgi:long-chain fatty acid transport protein
MRIDRLLPFAFLAPSLASAAAFYVPDLGVRALGRAGAFVARADDLTAAWYNPAGLADLGGTRFLGDVVFVKQSVFFQRTDERGAAGSFFPVGNTAFPFTIPFLGLSTDFGLKNLTFAASVYGPLSSSYAYPASGPQRYSLIDSGVLEALTQLSVGWRIAPWLRVGASFQWVWTSARQNLTLAVLPGSEGQSDVRVRFDVTDRFTPNFHFGFLVSPVSFLDVGFSIKPPMPVNADGTLQIDPADVASLRASQPGLRNLAINGDQVSLGFELPLVLRGGVRFKQPRFDVEADFVYERWTGFSRLEVMPKDITFTLDTEPSTLSPLVQERGYGSAWSLRLGSDIEVFPGRLTARLGYYFETSAIPPRSLNVSVVDMDKHGTTVGLTARFAWFTFSLAYAHVQLAEQRVTDSISRQINLTFLLLGQDAPPVGHGLYRSGYDILALGIGIDLDTLAGWTRSR